MKEILERYSIDCSTFAASVTDINSMPVDILTDVAYDFGIIGVPESEIKVMVKFVAQVIASGEQSESVVRVSAWKKLAEWRKKKSVAGDVDAALLETETETEQDQNEHGNMLDSNKKPDIIIHTNQQEDSNMNNTNNVEAVEAVETVEAVEAVEAVEIQLTASEAVQETASFAPTRGRGRPKLAETAYDRAVKIFQNFHDSRANGISAAIAAGIPKASANSYASKYWQTLAAAAAAAA